MIWVGSCTWKYRTGTDRIFTDRSSQSYIYYYSAPKIYPISTGHSKNQSIILFHETCIWCSGYISWLWRARRCRRSRLGFEPHSARWYFIFLPIHFFYWSTCISNDPGSEFFVEDCLTLSYNISKPQYPVDPERSLYIMSAPKIYPIRRVIQRNQAQYCSVRLVFNKRSGAVVTSPEGLDEASPLRSVLCNLFPWLCWDVEILEGGFQVVFVSLLLTTVGAFAHF